jgi:integrase/recombinase XerD
LGIDYPYSKELKSMLYSIGNIKYSNTFKSFYTDDTEERLRAVIKVFRDVADVDISAMSKKGHHVPPPVKGDAVPVDDAIRIDDVTGGEADSGSAGTGESFRSPAEVTDNREEEEDLDYYRESYTRPSAEKGRMFGRSYRTGSYGPVNFTVRENENLLVIKFKGRYEKEWIKELYSYGKARFDNTRFEWHLTWSKLTCDSLADYFSQKGIEVTVSRKVLPVALAEQRKAEGDKIRGRTLMPEAIDALRVMKEYLADTRYSARTSQSYLPQLELFFKYYHHKSPDRITTKDITTFIHDFIIELGYSASYQNQVVSAIKTYFDITGHRKVDTKELERPRRGRALPKVFSKEEIMRILNALRNTKHKLILWVVYSCGLRRSEVTNIRLSDLDRSRKIVHIKEGKGQMDRIVPVSDKVWARIDEYLESYAPKVWLFEGADKKKYSVESVYQIFKAALRKAGINRDVGIHSLRHSYATHLHESGLDIRYIQELLGHKSTKTTEIYTHVSRRNLITVRSPIEDMDLK